MRLQPIHKSTMLKEVRANGMKIVNIAPSNYNVNSVWGSGYECLVTIGRDGVYYVVNNYEKYSIYTNIELLDRVINEIKSCMCNAELGKTVRFWEAM